MEGREPSVELISRKLYLLTARLQIQRLNLSTPGIATASLGVVHGPLIWPAANDGKGRVNDN